jgi:putative FmdB family regulatory protein
MPFYEYECENCKFYTEVMQKISDEPLKKCPSCGKNQLKKLISAPNFRLKGAGWYETDFKSDKENKRNLAGAEKEETSSSASDSASSESKPAASASETKSTESKPAAAESKPSITTKPSVTTKKPAARAASKPAAKKAPARSSRPPAKKKAAKKARR